MCHLCLQAFDHPEPCPFTKEEDRMLEVYKAMNIQVVVLGDVATCSAVVGHEPFRGPWCVHHTEDGGSIWIRTQTAR
jgi:hypothetical protein